MTTDLSLTTNNLFGEQDLIAGNFEGPGIVIKTTIVNNLLSVSGSEDSYAGEFTTGDIPVTKLCLVYIEQFLILICKLV